MSISKKTLIHRLEAMLIEIVENPAVSIDKQLEASAQIIALRKSNPIPKRRKRLKQQVSVSMGILGTR